MTTKHRIKTVIKLVVAAGVLAVFLVMAATIGLLKIAVQRQDTRNLTYMIIDEAEKISTPVPVEAKTGQKYIHEARLVLPANPIRLHYYHSPKLSDDTPEEVHITYPFLTGRPRTLLMNATNLEDAFDAVPELQACTRGLRLVFIERSNDGEDLVFSKQLSDKRTLYVYSETQCKADKKELIEYLRKIDSY